jgi:hypothetical protein
MSHVPPRKYVDVLVTDEVRAGQALGTVIFYMVASQTASIPATD